MLYLAFDLDGTLINSLPYHLEAFRELMLERGVKVKESEIKKMDLKKFK
jgi:beta-phosphoglucomutase-like phosphatase (HAD superfamily)